MPDPISITVSESNALPGASVTVTLASTPVTLYGSSVAVTVANSALASGAGKTIVSSGAIADLTSAQQLEVGEGTIVVTTDGYRYIYSGSGSKTNPASYVILADITPDWSALSGKPSTFSPSAHAASHGSGGADAITVAVSQVTGLQTALDGKQASGSYAAASHGHEIADVSGLSTALDGKQATLATGTEGDVLTYSSGSWVAAAPAGGGSLPAGSQSDLLAYDEGEWAAKTLTQVLPPASVGGDTLVWDNVTATWTAQQPPAGIFPPAEPSDGDVLTWSATNEAWESQPPSGGGGGGGDYLPLTGGTMTGNIAFDGTSGQAIGKGWFDSNRGGNYGISLYCSIGYQANWQAGWLTCTEQDLTTPRPLYLDSGAGTTLRAWNSAENEGVEVSHTGIAFPDGSTQITAYTGASQLPTNASTNDILSWNGSSWVAVMPSTPGLPSGSNGQYLKYDGSNWVAGSSPLPNGTAEGETLYWNTATSTWSSAPVLLPDWNAQVGYAVGQLSSYDGRLWRATNTGMGNTPADGSGYWTALTASSSLPSGSSDGDVLTYDSDASAWIAAAPVKELPEAPGDGKVLTYSNNASAWIASDPPPVELYDFLTANETMETSGAASSLSLHLESGCAYVIEGVALMSNTAGDEQVYFGLRLLALDEDGEVYLEVDTLSGDSSAVFRLPVVPDQSLATVVSGCSSTATYRIPFRALVRVSGSVSSTDAAVWYGGGGGVVTIYGGSWMSARRVTLAD